MPNSQPANQPRRTLLLTGASRGIGHATVKRFSAAGWRVITCSRHAFPENCPWQMGPEDHIQLDLADAHDRLDGVGAIMATHVFGAPCRPEQVEALGAERGIPVLFDAAHGFGGLRAGRPLGGFGEVEVGDGDVRP